MDYTEYLRSEHWIAFRDKAVKNAEKKCCLCASRNVELNVHHNNYQCLWNERFSDVAVLCRNCHEQVHGILPEPPKDKVMESVLTPIDKLKERIAAARDPGKRDRLKAKLFILESDLPPSDMAKRLMEVRDSF